MNLQDYKTLSLEEKIELIQTCPGHIFLEVKEQDDPHQTTFECPFCGMTNRYNGLKNNSMKLCEIGSLSYDELFQTMGVYRSDLYTIIISKLPSLKEILLKKNTALSEKELDEILFPIWMQHFMMGKTSKIISKQLRIYGAFSIENVRQFVMERYQGEVPDISIVKHDIEWNYRGSILAQLELGRKERPLGAPPDYYKKKYGKFSKEIIKMAPLLPAEESSEAREVTPEKKQPGSLVLKDTSSVRERRYLKALRKALTYSERERLVYGFGYDREILEKPKLFEKKMEKR